MSLPSTTTCKRQRVERHTVRPDFYAPGKVECDETAVDPVRPEGTTNETKGQDGEVLEGVNVMKS